MQKNITIEKLENSQVKILFEISWEIVEKERDSALKILSKNVKIDGFREGKVPAEILEKNIGEQAILEEMAGSVINKEFPEALKEKNIDAIGQPMIQVTKLAKGNPFEFSAIVSVLPEIKLSDYKNISKKHKKDLEIESTIKDSDLEETIANIKTMFAKRKLFEKMQNMSEEEKIKESLESQNKKDESVEDVQKRIDEKLEIPELTDEFVKELGPFENVEDFKEKVKENMVLENKRKSEEKFRISTIEEIVESSKIDVPQLLIGLEVERMASRLRGDVERMGMKFDAYLSGLKKTESDLRKEMEGDAKKRAAAQLVINQIAKEEKLIPNEEKVIKEIEAITKAYPEINANQARGYIENILLNDMVFNFLQEQK